MGIGDSGTTARSPLRKRRRSGSTRRWRVLRQSVLARDGHRCATCGNYGNDIDHVIPKALGGLDTLDNLRVRCARCNRPEGARIARQARHATNIPGALRPKARTYPGAIRLER